VPEERLRADARREVAEHLYSALYRPIDVEAGQLRLPLSAGQQVAVRVPFVRASLPPRKNRRVIIKVSRS